MPPSNHLCGTKGIGAGPGPSSADTRRRTRQEAAGPCPLADGPGHLQREGGRKGVPAGRAVPEIMNQATTRIDPWDPTTSAIRMSMVI